MTKNYIEMLMRLFLTGKQHGAKSGLHCSRQLAYALNQPQKHFKTIHVAGTNGKGSVSTKIAKALEFSGYKTGLYTSPHLSCFRERIVIQSQMISEEEISHGLEQLFTLADRLKLTPTFFEFTTFLAFEYFRKQKVDVAVIETGLGGRLDATNVVDPVLSVITSISHDHKEILGETLEQIAAEKAGIIKHRVPVVVGPRANFSNIRAKAELTQSPLICCSKVKGFYDFENQEIARQSLLAVNSFFHIPLEATEKALSYRPPCRFENIGGIILDVAHNPDGFKRLIEAIDYHYPQEPIRALIGISSDKEINMCLKILASRASHIHLVEAPTQRAASIHEMGHLLKKLGYDSFSSENSLLETFETSCKMAAENGERLIVCGSFYLMPPIRKALGCDVPQDPFSLSEKRVELSLPSSLDLLRN